MAKKETVKKEVFNVSIGFTTGSEYKFKKSQVKSLKEADAIVKKAWADKKTRQIGVSRKLVNA